MPIASAVQAEYAFVTTLQDNNARFSVLVSNPGGSVTSNEVLLQVDPVLVPPMITSQPASVAVTAGQPATFMVTANGTAPLSYQWLREGTPVPGATDPTFGLQTTSLADNGAQFSVRVSNPAGSLTSQVAVLAVAPAPVAPAIVNVDGPAALSRGAVGTFTVTASGTPPLSYQWRLNGVDIPGATASSYTLDPVSLADHLTAYSVAVTNSVGKVASRALVLRIAAVPDVGAGYFFSLAGSPTRGVFSWGSNERIVLGRNPELGSDATPGVKVLAQANGASVQQVVGGLRHALALLSDGRVLGWGGNVEGALGIGVREALNFEESVEVLLPPATLIQQVIAGADFSIARDSTGSLWGWGLNNSGQTGIGVSGGENLLTNGQLRPVPVLLPPDKRFIDIAAGRAFAIALDSDGGIWGWGSTTSAILVNQIPRLLDLGIPPGVRPIRIMAAERQIFFIDADGNAWALGENDRGELGVGPGVGNSLFPVTRATKVVLPLTSGVVVVDIEGGENHTLFLTSDGAVYAAGEEQNSALGNGQSGFSTIQETPVRTLIGPPGLRVIGLAAGRMHSLGLLSDGSVVGWGANSLGRVGDGEQTNRSTPVSSSGLKLE